MLSRFITSNEVPFNKNTTKSNNYIKEGIKSEHAVPNATPSQTTITQEPLNTSTQRSFESKQTQTDDEDSMESMTDLQLQNMITIIINTPGYPQRSLRLQSIIDSLQ